MLDNQGTKASISNCTTGHPLKLWDSKAGFE
jgi:hypothetical protein